MKVLIVDDSKVIAVSVSEMLKMAQMQAIHVNNGAEALDWFELGNNCDLVLLDWNMPVMNGLEFLEKNKKDNFCQVPVIMMTTENKPDYIMKALALGAKEYIMKPFTSDILITKIQSVKGS